MHRLEAEKAYILMTRSFRDSSLLVEFFDEQHGVWTGLMKGVREGSTSRRRTSRVHLELFQCVSVAAQGRGELLTVTRCESGVSPAGPGLTGAALIQGLYLNELLHRLVPVGEPQPGLFEAYHRAILALSTGLKGSELACSTVEMHLLAQAGDVPYVPSADQPRALRYQMQQWLRRRGIYLRTPLYFKVLSEPKEGGSGAKTRMEG